MTEPTFGIAVRVQLQLLSTEGGGLSKPVRDGYRPLCSVEGRDAEIVIGMCVLRLEAPIPPGSNGSGTLKFALQVTPIARKCLRPNSSFRLLEGTLPIASGVVLAVEEAGRSEASF